MTSAEPISRAQLDDLIIAGDQNRVLDALFEPASDRVNFGPSEMTAGDIVVYTVLTFHGETLNGGVIQYLGNQSGDWAHHCGPSFRRIGGDIYAQIIEDCIRSFTTAQSAQDPKWESDFDNADDDVIEEIEQRFWDRYNEHKTEIPDMLYAHVVSNRDFYAPFNAGA